MFEPFVDTNLILSEKNLNSTIMGRANANENHSSYLLPTQYTLPGVVQYLQHEWNKFDTEKAQWEMEKIQFKKKISNLQEDLVCERTLKNDLEFKIKALQTSLKEEKIKFHKLKFGDDSMPPDIDADNDNITEFLFPIERVDEKLKKKLANYDYELSREELNKMVKIVFDKMTSLNKYYFRHEDYVEAAKSILVSYPHLAKFDSISERIIREKLRQRFSALRSREKQGSNPQIEKAREKFTPAHKKRPAGATSDEETPTKTSRRRRSKVVTKKKSKSNEKINDDEDSSSPEPTLRLPIVNNTTPAISNTTPPVHNTRAASRSSLNITKLTVNGNSSENLTQNQPETQVVTQSQNSSQAEDQNKNQTEILAAPPIENGNNTVITCSDSQVEKNTTSIVNLTEYQAQPTIRISDSILKIINDENDKKIIIQSSDSE